MDGMRNLLIILVIAGLSLIGGCIADTTNETDLSILALQESDLPAGYIIDQPFTPILDDIECDSDFCVLAGGDFSTSKAAETGNISIDQEILVYSKPVTKELLDVVFNESYPELSTWNLGSVDAPEIRNASVAFNYTVPENIGPQNPPLTGYVIVFGTGDVFEVFKSTGGSFDDLKEIAEIAAEKLESAYEAGEPVWKGIPRFEPRKKVKTEETPATTSP